ncbi:phosphoenolpyruvate synthase [Alkalihalobacillus oceani]|uniref:phosphoenolpyruvate synthase n=1 Tax=Halalkalibacter oceani TaxID=1653776 RepID=UPI00203EF58D|nr:phosphoenolpyruvate synthase [Halalkalibacter oceani]
MEPYILRFSEIDHTTLKSVGGKGLNIGKLLQIDGLKIPDGFCVTTKAYKEAIENLPELTGLFERLVGLKATDKAQISEISKEIRLTIEGSRMPKIVENEIKQALSLSESQEAYAIRSSSTAEDLPFASFAGQQDTYLNIKGENHILQHVIKCWASLFTERAVTYRIQNGFDHRKVFLSVIIQEMVFPQASGIMFTADPMTSDRKSVTIDAGFGLGEALVSGLVNPDIHKIQNGTITERKLGTQEMEIKPLLHGGISEHKIEKSKEPKSVLSDMQILQLARIGKKIEAHFNSPQDIEWCLADNEFYIVQSRPITTLFPLPPIKGKKKPRVYMSIGHTQMMTDTMNPLGMSFFEMISETSLDRIGGRLFADITHDLSSKIGRIRLLSATGQQDPLIQGAIKSLLEDKAFMASLPQGKRNVKGGIFTASTMIEAVRMYNKNDPSVLVEVLKQFENELIELDKQLSELSGEQALKFIEHDRDHLLAMAYNPIILGAIIAAILVNNWLNKNIEKWLGDRNIADILSKSLDHNITTEMGLALGDIADMIRQYPDVIAFISTKPDDERFFEEMERLQGGKEVRKMFGHFLRKFGMRCPGEIDITKDRFEEKPTQLIPVLLNNIHVLQPGEHRQRFYEGKLDAKKTQDNIIDRLRNHNSREKRIKKVMKRISFLRNFIGYREEPKYYIVRRYQIYKKALLKEAETLVNQGIIKEREDIFYLYFDELLQVVKTNELDYSLIEERKKDYIHFEKLTPPRILTSAGFVPPVRYSTKDIPEGALSGIPVSSGIVEGRARVILSVEEAQLEKGDILITQFTDPSWTPLFVTISGLVTEVGGFTTHGAVITREYGLPGVVGVENATKLIKDGQRIRVDGTKGYIEILKV